jgi:small subunit ribosomal protein S6
MREYELTVVYDLAVAEAGGPDASVEQLTSTVESRGGKVLRVDHWGRRRMAYPIGRVIDADYVVSRVELEPAAVAPLEATLRIDEKVYRFLVVRADELPVPPPPREPRQMAPQAPEAAAPVEAVAPPEPPAVSIAEAPAEAVAPAEATAEVAAAVEEAPLAEEVIDAPVAPEEAAEAASEEPTA